jgi:hypothetical protein
LQDGWPSLNSNVLDVLKQLPELYDAPGLIPSILLFLHSYAKNSFQNWKKLKIISKRTFPVQFSVQSLMTTKEIGYSNKKVEYKGNVILWNSFHKKEKKNTLNFAIAQVP